MDDSDDLVAADTNDGTADSVKYTFNLFGSEGGTVISNWASFGENGASRNKGNSSHRLCFC